VLPIGQIVYDHYPLGNCCHLPFPLCLQGIVINDKPLGPEALERRLAQRSIDGPAPAKPSRMRKVCVRRAGAGRQCNQLMTTFSYSTRNMGETDSSEKTYLRASPSQNIRQGEAAYRVAGSDFFRCIYPECDLHEIS
jgi:hypothetical protein